MSKTDKKNIPLYSIDRFQKESGQPKQFKIEVFDKNRNFKVTYPHRHDFYEILFITEGTGKHTIDFQDHLIKPSSVFFLSPGQIHSLELSDDIKGFIFLFTSEFYLLNKQDKNKLLELPFFYNISNSYSPIYPDAENTQTLTRYFQQAIEENNNIIEDSEDIIRAVLDIILLTCKRLYPENQKDNLSKGNLLVKRLKQLIEEKYQQNLSVKDYADLLSISSNHLSETVKNLTGRTPTDLINDKLLLEIKRLLLHTDLTISEIAHQLHFTDQSYFSRYFKKQTGMSPREFREQAIKST